MLRFALSQVWIDPQQGSIRASDIVLWKTPDRRVAALLKPALSGGEAVAQAQQDVAAHPRALAKIGVAVAGIEVGRALDVDQRQAGEAATNAFMRVSSVPGSICPIRLWSKILLERWSALSAGDT